MEVGANRPALAFARAEWQAFLGSVRFSELDWSGPQVSAASRQRRVGRVLG